MRMKMTEIEDRMKGRKCVFLVAWKCGKLESYASQRYGHAHVDVNIIFACINARDSTSNENRRVSSWKSQFMSISLLLIVTFFLHFPNGVWREMRKKRLPRKINYVAQSQTMRQTKPI